jgi:hypothetical protein
MIDNIEAIVTSSGKIKKILVDAHTIDNKRIEFENEYLFLYNSIERFTQITSSYTLIPTENTIPKIILLRPLVLDSMLFLLLFYYGNKNRWDDFKYVLEDCLAEGVSKQFYTLKKACETEGVSKEKSEEILTKFHSDWILFFESDSTIHNPRPKKFNFSITPSKIEERLKNTELIIRFHSLNNLYQVLSKYEHNTIVSLVLSKEYNYEVKSLKGIEETILEGYLDLLKVIAKSYININGGVAKSVFDEYDYLFTNWKKQNDRN